MTDHPDSKKPGLVLAEPYTARQCPECETWVYVNDGPFAENDPTKTLADWLHWERLHLEATGRTSIIGFPYFRFNDTPVHAVRDTEAAETHALETSNPVTKSITARLDELQHRPDPEPPGIGR